MGSCGCISQPTTRGHSWCPPPTPPCGLAAGQALLVEVVAEVGAPPDEAQTPGAGRGGVGQIAARQAAAAAVVRVVPEVDALVPAQREARPALAAPGDAQLAVVVALDPAAAAIVVVGQQVRALPVAGV